MRGRFKRLLWLPLVAVLFVAPGSAMAATVVNGDFDSGLSGWQVQHATGAGDWFAYSGTAAPIGSKRPTPADPVQPPPQGFHAAIADEYDPDTLILYQDVFLEPGASHELSLLAYYNSYAPIAIPTPNTLSVDEEALRRGSGVQANQQFRIDVMKPDAPLESVDPADILRTVFQTRRGGAEEMPPTRMTADLSAFAGQTVRLRIAVAARTEVLNAGVDAVSITSTRGKSSGSRGSTGRPILFSFGKVKRNSRDGTAILKVHVSGPGLLSARDASATAGTAGAGGERGAGRLIRPVTLGAKAAKTMTIRLRPTLRALRILRRKHRLRVKVGVVFFPENTSSEAGTVPVVLRLDALRKRR